MQSCTPRDNSVLTCFYIVLCRVFFCADVRKCCILFGCHLFLCARSHLTPPQRCCGIEVAPSHTLTVCAALKRTYVNISYSMRTHSFVYKLGENWQNCHRLHHKKHLGLNALSDKSACHGQTQIEIRIQIQL